MYETIAQANKEKKKVATLVRYKELDSLRGFAALYVMFFHLSRISGMDNRFLNNGVTGVDLFFIISGYVIFMSLENTKKPRDFVVSRISRLFPTYLIMMAITCLVIFIFARGQSPSFLTILMNTTMLQPWFLVPYIDDSYWTLTVELLFYIAMLYLFIIKKLGKIVIIGIVGMVFLFLYYLILGYYAPESFFYIVPRYVLPLTSHVELFFAGILFYKLKSFKNAWHPHLLIAGCYLLSLFYFDKAGRAHFLIGFTDYAVSVFLYFVVFYLFVYDKLKRFNYSILVFFGSISYGVYLLHQKFAIVLYPYLVNEHGFSRIAAIMLLVALIIAISAFVTFKIERPVIKYIRNKYIPYSSK